MKNYPSNYPVTNAKIIDHHTPLSQDPPRVLIFYTGGTMGMKVDNNGVLRPVKGYLSERLKLMPELDEPHMPKVEVVEYDEIIDSSDMGPEDWAKIALDIGNNYFDYDGFVVIMGTDTMAYAASALSFMLENLGKTVVITGSMIPFYKGYSDARRNLLLSLKLAGYSYIPEVCVYFHDKLLRGCRSKKVSSEQLDAFDSPNCRPLATAGVHVNINTEELLRPPLLPLRIHTKMETNVIVLRLIPGFHDDPLLTMNPGIKAIVLELYGAGNAPSKKTTLTKIIQNATAEGIVVAVTTQCIRGAVDLEAYAVGKQIMDAGAISSADMTVEAVATKLSYLIGRGLNAEQVKEAMHMNLRGELSPNTTMTTAPSSYRTSKL